MTRPQLVEIKDSSGASKAVMIASLGFNCFRIQLNAGEEPVDVLWASEDFQSGEVRPSRCGIPILFPFPGRIGNARFDWEGKEYELEATDGLGNAIHGFVHTRPWKVIAHEGESVVAVFDSRDFAHELGHRWPTSFRITAQYKISIDQLETTYTVENPSDVSLPFGLGLHPYFRVPRNMTGEQRLTVQAPVGRQWSLDNLIPDGKSVALSNDHPLNEGQPFVDMEYDAVFSDLPVSDESIEASYIDHEKSIKTTITSDASFPVSVIYTPPHREAFCIEPYTCLPDPFESNQNNSGLGVSMLAPGQSKRFRVTYRVEKLNENTGP